MEAYCVNCGIGPCKGCDTPVQLTFDLQPSVAERNRIDQTWADASFAKSPFVFREDVFTPGEAAALQPLVDSITPENRHEELVVKPAHYTQYVIEPITFIMRNKMEFWRGNVIKYVARAGSKRYDNMDATQSEITDLRKAIRYAEMRINMLNGETEL
jgi:Protein of unknwon function (DUF3310)